MPVRVRLLRRRDDRVPARGVDMRPEASEPSRLEEIRRKVALAARKGDQWLDLPDHGSPPRSPGVRALDSSRRYASLAASRPVGPTTSAARMRRSRSAGKPSSKAIPAAATRRLRGRPHPLISPQHARMHPEPSDERPETSRVEPPAPTPTLPPHPSQRSTALDAKHHDRSRGRVLWRAPRDTPLCHPVRRTGPRPIGQADA